MIPMRTSSIFKSRWVALVWAAGILRFAYDVAESAPKDSSASNNAAEQPTDVAGAPVTPEDEKKVGEILNGL
jgi:hypothetical protein